MHLFANKYYFQQLKSSNIFKRSHATYYINCLEYVINIKLHIVLDTG